MPPFSPLAERYWAKVERRGDDECWPWHGSHDRKTGHGKLLYVTGSNSTTNAHRVAWELAYGPIPDGAYVLHDCDNGWCQNPAHLHLGSHEMNMREAAERNRHGPRPGGRVMVDVEAIRAACEHESQQTVAARFGVSQTTVSRIVTRCGAYADEWKSWGKKR